MTILQSQASYGALADFLDEDKETHIPTYLMLVFSGTEMPQTQMMPVGSGISNSTVTVFAKTKATSRSMTHSQR